MASSTEPASAPKSSARASSRSGTPSSRSHDHASDDRRAACALAALPGCGGEEAAVPDGRHFSYIRSASPEQGRIEFDPADFLTGEEAQRAALEDGAIAPGEAVPNDYYIRDRDRTIRTMLLARTASVTAVRCNGGCSEGHPAVLDEFLASFSQKEPPTLEDAYRGSYSQYWITVAGSRVVAVDEQYLP